MSESKEKVDNPCGEFGRDQKAALAWFVFIVIGGACLTAKLSVIDSWMWENDSELLDMEMYAENRKASTSIPSESLDERQAGDAASVFIRSIQAAYAK